MDGASSKSADCETFRITLIITPSRAARGGIGIVPSSFLRMTRDWEKFFPIKRQTTRCDATVPKADGTYSPKYAEWRVALVSWIHRQDKDEKGEGRGGEVKDDEGTWQVDPKSDEALSTTTTDTLVMVCCKSASVVRIWTWVGPQQLAWPGLESLLNFNIDNNFYHYKRLLYYEKLLSRLLRPAELRGRTETRRDCELKDRMLWRRGGNERPTDEPNN